MSTNRPHLFQYDNALRFLRDFVQYEKLNTARFSIRRWAKEMGMSNHALLVFILQGKRSLTLKQASALAEGLKLSSAERLYFRALIQLSQASTDEERDLCRLWISDLNPGTHAHVREIDEYQVLSRWIHFAILAMTDLRDFAFGIDAIYERFGGRVDRLEIATAIDRLFEIQLLVKTDDRYRIGSYRTTSRDDRPNPAVQEYHRSVLNLASEAVRTQSVHEREFQSMAMAVAEKKIPLAKELIRKFAHQFTIAMRDEPGDSVYQFNLQFFRLTELPSPAVVSDETLATEKVPAPSPTPENSRSSVREFI